jgi:CBS domain-containing protein
MPLLKDVMLPTSEVVAPDASTTEAAQKMKALDVGALPVCDGQTLIGMVTASDLVSRVMALRRNPDEARVREAMRQGHLFCYEDDETEIAWNIMAKRRVRCLPVLSKGKQIVGIVTQPPEQQRYGSKNNVVQSEPRGEHPWAISW